MSGPAGPQAPPGGVPVCPRHPDRESYVRCQRCERPTCPQCQRVAAVGIHCVDCVREAAHTTPAARTTFGGAVRQGRPVVTLTMIGLCGAAFLVQYAVPDLTYRLGFSPVVAAREPWRFLTAAFLHGGVVHILFNMYALWLFGPYLESLFGRLRFATLYLLCALGGSVGSLVLASSPSAEGWYQLSVGASGAVFGLFGALVVVQRRLNQRFGQVVVLIVINGAIGFVVPNIAWQAHLGGLVTGLVLGVVLAFAPRRTRTPVQVAGTVAVAVVLLAASVGKLAAAGAL